MAAPFDVDRVQGDLDAAVRAVLEAHKLEPFLTVGWVLLVDLEVSDVEDFDGAPGEWVGSVRGPGVRWSSGRGMLALAAAQFDRDD